MSEQPKFRIQAVADATGVPAATLRAWERRYAVPAPVRTPGAYRLYSSRDVECVSHMKALCDAGMPASQAAESVLRAAPLSTAAEGAPADSFSASSSRLVQAACAMDLRALEEELSVAATLGSASELFDRVISPALVRLGDLWHQGELSIGHEHLATELLQGAAYQWLRLVQPKAIGRTALLACFSAEVHVLPLYGVGFRLAEWGCRSAILGANTPPSGLAVAVQNLKPCLVGLSVTLAPKAADALLDGYANAAGRVPWVVGGAAAESLRSLVEERGGHVAPRDGVQLHALFERLLTRLGS